MKKTLISLSVAALFGSSMAHAEGYTPTVTTTGNNFTMVSASDGLTGGTNDVTFTWDGTYRTSVVNDGTNNATLSSPSPFSGKKWTAHHVNVYGPGTYTFYTGCASGGIASTTYNPSCGTGVTYTLTVGAGQVGAHMLFNWSTSSDIDVVILWDMNKSWAQTGTVSAFNAGGTNTINTVWNGVSVDTDNDPDTYTGTKMVDGPFVGQSANFNVNGILPVGATSSAGATISSGAGTVTVSSVVDKASLGVAPVGIAMEDGLSYTVTGVAGSVTMQLTFPTNIAGKTLYKISAGTFTPIPEADFTRLDDGLSITMVIADNGAYDTDPAVGTVMDPIAAGAPLAVAPPLGEASGGGGCAFNPNGKFDASLILTLLASLGYLGWKRKRHN